MSFKTNSRTHLIVSQDQRAFVRIGGQTQMNVIHAIVKILPYFVSKILKENLFEM